MSVKAWARPSEMKQGYPDQPSLWGNFGKPVPNGIRQMALGDCWFLAAVSAISEEPDRIYRVFDNKDYSNKGIFRIYFWSKDAWYGVNVDDRLPSRGWG